MLHCNSKKNQSGELDVCKICIMSNRQKKFRDKFRYFCLQLACLIFETPLHQFRPLSNEIFFSKKDSHHHTSCHTRFLFCVNKSRRTNSWRRLYRFEGDLCLFADENFSFSNSKQSDPFLQKKIHFCNKFFFLP